MVCKFYVLTKTEVINVFIVETLFWLYVLINFLLITILYYINNILYSTNIF